MNGNGSLIPCCNFSKDNSCKLFGLESLVWWCLDVGLSHLHSGPGAFVFFEDDPEGVNHPGQEEAQSKKQVDAKVWQNKMLTVQLKYPYKSAK